MDGLIPGRIVHYVAPGSADGTYPAAHRAAVITQVYPEQDTEGPWRADLMVCNPTGVHFAQGVPYDADGGAPYSWHWIERSEPAARKVASDGG
jgi:hypothetical protein